ncbi:hypothetical protein DM01DRAFT_1337720, partial [Hesseltinella vesiculosa]
MTVFFVSVTGGILTLQPATSLDQKQKGLSRHVVWQVTAGISGFLGFGAIFYNKLLSQKAHFTSAHGQLGLLVILLLLAQVSFGGAVVYRLAWKRFWKYHRISGYVLVVLLLTTV